MASAQQDKEQPPTVQDDTQEQSQPQKSEDVQNPPQGQTQETTVPSIQEDMYAFELKYRQVGYHIGSHPATKTHLGGGW